MDRGRVHRAHSIPRCALGHREDLPLASRQQYIGFVWDLEAKTVFLPEQKRARIDTLLADWVADDARFNAHDAASLHGKLVYTSSIYPLIRPFIRAASMFAHGFQSPRARLHPPRSLVNDIKRIHQLLIMLPPELPLSTPEPLDIGWWGDASSSFGVGVCVGHFWGVWSWTAGTKVGPCQLVG